MNPTANPWRLGVRDIVHRPGEMRERRFEVPVDERLGEGLARVPAGGVIEADVRLESVHEGILVTGELDTEYEGECSRCLTELHEPLRVDFQELFAYAPVDDDLEYEVRDDSVDLEQVVRDAVVLALPFQPVCSPDCAGLDSETGERLDTRPEMPAERPLDPRWAGLAGLARGSAGQDPADTEER